MPAIEDVRYRKVSCVRLFLENAGMSKHNCSVWGNCGATLKNRLQNLQHGAIRAISKNCRYNGDPDSLMNEMNLLNVQQLIDFNTAQMIWKAKHGLAPEYISEMFVPIQSLRDHNTRIYTAFTQPKRT